MVEEKTKEQKSPEYELVEIPTGSALAFRTPNGEILTTEQLLVEIANKVDKIVRAF